MPGLSQYLIGAAELAVIFTALGLGAFHVRALLVPGWSGAVARLAELILGFSALIVISELVGMVGLFSEAPLTIACVAAGLGAAAYARPRAPEAGRDIAPAVSIAMFVVALAATLLVVAHWTVPTQESLDTGMYYQDTTWYHMSFSGRFAQEGTIGPLHFTDPLKLTAWFYPQNSELLHGVGLVVFENDFLSPMINLGLLLCALLAGWCVGRPFGVGLATLLATALVFDSDMIIGSQAGNAPNDAAGLFFLLALLAFLVTGWVNERARPEADRGLAGVGAGALTLAGLAAGLGIGTKITLLALLGVLTLGVVFLAGRRGWLRASAIWLGAMFATGGFWYARNLVYAANPFPQISKLGPIDLPGPDQVPALYPRAPHKLSEYYNDPDVWRDYLVPILDKRLGPLWFVILGVVAIGLAAALIWGGSRLLRVLAVTGIVAGIAYVFTPLTASGQLGEPTGFDANLRYVAPPVLLGLVLLPLVPALRRGPFPWVVSALLGALLISGTVGAPTWSSGHELGAAIMTSLLVGVPIAIFAASRAGLPAPVLAMAALAGFVVLVALGRPEQTDYLHDRYDSALAPPLEGGFRSSPEWFPLQQWGKEARDERIAVVGRASAFGQYVFYGDDNSNHVQYIGNELNRGTFRQIGEDCKRYRRTVNEGDYDYLVTTPRINEDESKIPIENVWTGNSKHSKAIIRSGPARVYRLRGDLDPADCADLKRPERAKRQPGASDDGDAELPAGEAAPEDPVTDPGGQGSQ